MTEPVWNCPAGIPELRPSQLKQLTAGELLDRYHALKRGFEETVNELTTRWLEKEDASE
jgi:hypothetical protein